MLEGFLRIADDLLDEGTSWNLSAYRDRFSPYADLSHITAADSGDAWADPFYGHVYGEWIAQGGGFYGRTMDMPPWPMDEVADLGFLRLPFARIPRVRVRSHSHLTELIERVQATVPPDGKLLLRGQISEYELGRPPQVLEALYGDEQAVEPSLAPSASRAGIDINKIMPTWCGLLRWLLDMLPPLEPGEDSRLRFHDWFTHYDFSRFALAIAQHYGLPSSGLDVTPSLEVALFFALHRFTKIVERPGWARYQRKVEWTKPSVIYAFVVPTKAHTIRYDAARPDFFITRPLRQHAFFLCGGWGYAKNQSATLLAVAMYLDDSYRAPELPTAAFLFPSADEDPFAAALEAVPIIARRTPSLEPFLSHLYWIEHD
ncbi:FRG domain-containing protein [Mesorhizobium sp.]|uniref:FRG domain-containing protein n=1 Tax=Mesorhizobium sp. TaxID=1871066 RepID=UPI000FE8FF2D|nr:FRG domain-containing protein [Mesorhizobium sp.]RWA81313.1 MAG: FRG domain-containing protein [Mesorhizobium sp.]